MSKSVDADEARRQPEKPIPIGEQLKGSPNVLRFIREILPNLKTLPVGPISHLVPPEEIWRFHRATMADERLRREPDYQKDWLDQLRELPATIIDIKSRFLTRQERVRIRGDSQYCSDAQQAAFELGLDYERPKTKLTLEDELHYLIGLDQQFRRHQAQLATKSQSPPPPDPSSDAKQFELQAETPPDGDAIGGGTGSKTPGKAGAASKPIESAGDKRKLQPCQKLAYFASRYAELKLERKLSAQEAYDYWKEYGFDTANKHTENAAELAGYQLPDSFPTFQTQLSHGRRAFNDSRYENRKGRKGRSIVSGDEID